MILAPLVTAFLLGPTVSPVEPAVGLQQASVPCETSPSRAEAWSVASDDGVHVLRVEPVGDDETTPRRFRMERDGEVVWRSTLPGGNPEVGTISSRGRAAVVLRSPSARNELRLVVIDPDGGLAFEREVQTTACPDQRGCSFPPVLGNLVEQLVISEAAGVVFVRRPNEWYERHALSDGRPLGPGSLRDSVLPQGQRGRFVETVALEGAPYLVVHVLATGNRALRSTYVLVDAALSVLAEVVVERGKVTCWTEYSDMVADIGRGNRTLRVDRDWQFSVRDTFGWTSYRLERASQRQYRVVSEGAVPEAVGR